MTFRGRTALVVLALTAVTMGVAFGIVWYHFVASQRGQLDEALLTVAHFEAAEAAAGKVDFSDAPGPSANAVGPLPKYGVVYSTYGQPLANTNFITPPPMPRTKPFEKGFDFEHDGVPMRGVVVEVASTGKRLLLASPREDIDDDAAILGRAMAIAFVVGCVWAALVAFGVASRLTRQHRIVGDVARRVAGGDTSARVEFDSADADLRQLAHDLNAMIERLVGLVAGQERFISHAAHELRTPLTSLRIELEHALRTANDREDYAAAVRGGLESAQRLSALAEDLLQLARLKAAPSQELTSLEEALSDAIADVAPLGRPREVFIDALPFSATIRGDRRGLARVFRNILENAVRFSPQRGCVRVEGTVANDAVVVQITDDGPGVDAADAQRIFEPFARAAVSEGWDGTGLGLPIARGLARSFGGDVTAVAGAGASFVIRLPLATS